MSDDGGKFPDPSPEERTRRAEHRHQEPVRRALGIEREGIRFRPSQEDAELAELLGVDLSREAK